MEQGRPPIYDSPETFQTMVETYFASTAKPTITGLAYFLGFESRQSFYDYEKREDFSYTVKRARLRIENIYEERLVDGGGAGSIFALKNLGWSDKSEQDVKIDGGVQLVFKKATNEAA